MDLNQMALDTIDLDVSMVRRAINLNITVTDQEEKTINEAIEALNSLRRSAQAYHLHPNTRVNDDE